MKKLPLQAYLANVPSQITGTPDTYIAISRMLRNENAIAAKQLVDSLRTTITTSAESLEDLKRSFNHRPPGSLSEAKTFCDTLGKDVEQLRTDVAPMQHLMKAPPACDLLDAGLRQTEVVDRILQMFQERLQDAYGIQVRVPEESEPAGAADVPAPSETVCTVDEVSIRPKPAMSKDPVTPKGKPSPKFDDVIPVTPKLEDFGISSADIAALAATPTHERLAVDGTPVYQPGLAATTGVEIGSGDYGEAVAKSMSALGIETPVEVADKFSARRHIALRGVMPGTTPRMTAGKARTLDFTGLAGGYYQGKQLDFGDEEDGLREKYGSVDGFWKESVGVEDCLKAVQVVKEHGHGFTQDEFVKFVEEKLPGVDGLAALVGLTKMKVLSVSKGENGEAVYQYRE